LAGLKLRLFRSEPFGAIASPPSVTVLKPLHGGEPGLEAALGTLFGQHYPGAVQLIFGLQDPADPALAVAERLRAAHPEANVAIVVDERQHGANRKVSNLINMAERATGEVLVLADSDIFVGSDYLRRVVAALEEPEVGIVTCPYFGRRLDGFWSRLAAMQISYQFLPSVAVGVGLGLATPCMGSTIALRREVLSEIGGFQAVADKLADDYALGEAVRATGRRSLVAPVLVAHGCSEGSFGELWAHELRWARTVRGIDPGGFAGSIVTYPLAWAIIATALLAGSPAALAGLLLAAVARLWMMQQVDKLTGSQAQEWWLAPVRDMLCLAVFVGSFFVRRVEWRGASFRLDRRGGLSSV
jgi:ceramide glucosyltransferase